MNEPFSVITGPIRANLSRNVHWMVPYKVYVFVDQKYTKETRGPKVSKRVCPYIWIQIIYCSFVFYEDFANVIDEP